MATAPTNATLEANLPSGGRVTVTTARLANQLCADTLAASRAAQSESDRPTQACSAVIAMDNPHTADTVQLWTDALARFGSASAALAHLIERHGRLVKVTFGAQHEFWAGAGKGVQARALCEALRLAEQQQRLAHTAMERLNDACATLEKDPSPRGVQQYIGDPEALFRAVDMALFYPAHYTVALSADPSGKAIQVLICAHAVKGQFPSRTWAHLPVFASTAPDQPWTNTLGSGLLPSPANPTEARPSRSTRKRGPKKPSSGPTRRTAVR